MKYIAGWEFHNLKSIGKTVSMGVWETGDMTCSGGKDTRATAGPLSTDKLAHNGLTSRFLTESMSAHLTSVSHNQFFGEFSN